MSYDISLVCSCGGPTRTGHLQVMSLASYQPLHSAMFVFASAKVRQKFGSSKHFREKMLIFKVKFPIFKIMY